MPEMHRNDKTYFLIPVTPLKNTKQILKKNNILYDSQF